jgi:cation diffusion facilitator family transporter
MSPEESASEEKTRVALSSVAAAVGLTAMKIVVGLMTGSLGILSEAAHSGLDLVAALVTVFAVRASAHPPDADHPYGHGKVESLSALFETLLLLLTCLWIIWEAVQRLFFHPVSVKASFWGFLVIAISIGVDIGRSRALMKVARKHQSQALEADALHFSTDVWSSSVVLLGLGLVFLAERLHQPWLVQADAVAALCVAGIVVWVSLQLGRKTLRDLMDAVPTDMVARAEGLVLAIPGVVSVPRIRMRRTGGEWFADVVIELPGDLSFEAAHGVTVAVEHQLAELLPGGDVVVHAEPVRAPEPTRA